MPSKNYNDEALETLYQMIEKLKDLESDEFKLLANKWGVVEKELYKMIENLVKIENPSLNQIFRSNQYKEFLAESKQLIEKYNSYSARVILENEFKFSELGVKTTNEILGYLGIGFNRLGVDKANVMIGLTKDNSPLFGLLNKAYPITVDNLVNTLINSQALGRSPIETARLMAKNMDGNNTRSLLIARTEQLRCNRESSLISMKESGVCKGWIRIESIDESTCDECIEGNGKKYSLDESFDSHPNCRGALLPDMG
jgi:SPP1 gp7 family putative phage head morphogenesis protein